MADESALVPVWTLATEAVAVPGLVSDGDMTPERLADLRTALATFAQAPIATLEMHPIERHRDSADGIALHASSPLAQQLSQARLGQRAEMRVGDVGETVHGTGGTTVARPLRPVDEGEKVPERRPKNRRCPIGIPPGR